MANQKITEVGEVNSLNFSDNIFVNSSNTLRQMPLSDIFANHGGVSMEVLWENPDLTADFAAQDIVLSNTANLYIFVYKNYSTGATTEDACFCVDEQLGGTMHIKSAASSTSNNYYTRNFTRDGNTISFANCYRKTMSSTSAGSIYNDYLIPTKVIGLSFGLNNFGIADYIVEQGTEGIWTWRKWNSGIAECWGRVGSKSYAMTTASTYGYYYTGDTSIDLPTGLFTKIDMATSDRCGGTTGNGLISTDVRTVTTTKISYFIWDTAAATLDVDVALNVKGTWK